MNVIALCEGHWVVGGGGGSITGGPLKETLITHHHCLEYRCQDSSKMNKMI